MKIHTKLFYNQLEKSSRAQNYYEQPEPKLDVSYSQMIPLIWSTDLKIKKKIEKNSIFNFNKLSIETVI